MSAEDDIKKLYASNDLGRTFLMFCGQLGSHGEMWLERFVIVITSLNRTYLPGSWGMYVPTVWDWSLYLGTIGLFFFLFLIFIRVLPMISMFEIRELVNEQHSHTKGEGHGHG